MQPQTFVFFGIVGSGKGTQIKLFTDFLKSKDGRESVYAGPGDGFRKLLESGSYTAILVKDSMNRGELQPNFLTNAIFANILISALTPEKNLFVDGYPRTLGQAETFEAMVKFFKRDSVKIIYIEVGKEEATKRMFLRGRHDDTEEGISRRFDEYKNNVIPAMNYFQDKKGYEIFTINGEQTREDVFKDIIKTLNF